MMNKPISDRSFLFAAVVGVLGGGVLIVTTILTRRGQMIFLPYGAMIVAMMLYFRSRRVASFAVRFGAAAGSLMVASLIMDVYLVTIVNPAVLRGSLWHIVWPLGVYLLLSSAASTIVAASTRSRALP
jgi:hypothetical protein